MKLSFKRELVKDIDNIIVDELVKLRGIKNKQEFSNPSHPFDIKLFKFKGAKKEEFAKTVRLLKEIKKKRESIVVYTDYDADGVTGGAILWETLHKLGFNVFPHIPDRKKEGYGFSKLGIDIVKKRYNPALIISVDHGITAKDKVEYAKKLGIKVVITDHHLKPKALPKAYAIFHLPELSGSGVSYFFSKEIFMSLSKQEANKQSNQVLKQLFKTDYISIASIGTVADLVPLMGGSRSIVKFGLKMINKIQRPGIIEILKESGIKNKPVITPYDIGFIIAPRINAIGRLEHAIKALRLLCTTSSQRAQRLAKILGESNKKRQNMVNQAVEEALQIIDNLSELPNLIVVQSPNWHEGIIGLIASKITEKYNRPSIVLTKTNGFYKASARSIPNFHITNFLRELSDLLIDVGGHSQAAGFTIEENKLKKLETKIKDKLSKVNKDIFEKEIIADFKIPIREITLNLINKIGFLEPFGIGNPKPLFFTKSKIINASVFGKNNNHLKIQVSDGTNKQPFEMVSFFNGDKFSQLSRNADIKLIYHLDKNYWRGRYFIKGIVKAFEV